MCSWNGVNFGKQICVFAEACKEEHLSLIVCVALALCFLAPCKAQRMVVTYYYPYDDPTCQQPFYKASWVLLEKGPFSSGVCDPSKYNGACSLNQRSICAYSMPWLPVTGYVGVPRWSNPPNCTGEVISVDVWRLGYCFLSSRNVFGSIYTKYGCGPGGYVWPTYKDAQCTNIISTQYDTSPQRFLKVG